jgi:hypothetical protein
MFTIYLSQCNDSKYGVACFFACTVILFLWVKSLLIQALKILQYHILITIMDMDETDYNGHEKPRRSSALSNKKKNTF